jgi:eukaryotic-like serine/threonine-protein kinase
MGLHVGQTFGDYAITGLVGAGGMGQVYKVQHSLTQRTEALKVLSTEVASEIQIKRFEREMRALAKLSHPNIGALHNAIHSENQLILLMEYIEGTTLESMFGAGRLAVETGVEYIKQVLLALGYAHHQGIVHRDVTPANVMVTADGQVKLTDFGLSKSYGDPLLTSCGEVLGSLPYLAPEQLKGATQPDRRSDLYSVGAILYEHLTGQKPFGANRRLAPVLTDSEGEPQPPSGLEPSLSPQWDEILRRALARDPARRYQSADEFLDAIAQLEQLPVADLPLPQLRTLGIGVAVGAGLILALAASPALNRFGRVAPVSTPWQRLHIAPPAFATVKTPPSAQTEPVATPRAAKAEEAPHEKRVVRSVPPSSFEAPPSQAPLAHTQTAPTVLSAPTASIRPAALTTAKAGPALSSPASTSISSREAGSTVAGRAGPDVNAPAAEESETEGSENPTPKKSGFWHKLNPFRKRHPDTHEGQ